MGAYRFFTNPRVSEPSILAQCLSQQNEIDQQEELLILSDTSQINLNHLSKSIEDKSDLGVLNDGLTLGYNLHGCVVLDSNYSCRGISSALTYKRDFPNSEQSKRIRSTRRDALPMDQKESYRWSLGVSNSTAYLGNASRLNFVFDREGDIYELLDDINNQGSTFTVRSQHNRLVKLEDGQTIKLQTYISNHESQSSYLVEVSADERGNKKRLAQLDLKYCKVKIKGPTHHEYETTFSPYLEMYLVQVKETIALKDKKPDNLIQWNILTNKPIKNVEQAKKVIEIYRSRWCIEDVFRGMKNKGLQLDSVTLKTGKALRKIGIMAFDISTIALKLRQARGGENHIPIEEVFDEQQVQCMEQLCDKLQGNTEKQQNPFKSDSLAWAAWVIAKLGGWSGFQSQRPPGIITMKRGLEKFSTLYLGWSIRLP